MIGRYFTMTAIAAALAAPTLALATAPAQLAQASNPPASTTPSSPSGTTAPETTPPADMRRDSTSDFQRTWQGDKKALENQLGIGHDRAHYRQELERLGFKVTATNKDEPDYLEYEVVSGTDTYEVQVSFDKQSSRSTKVAVTSNLVRDSATKREMSGERR